MYKWNKKNKWNEWANELIVMKFLFTGLQSLDCEAPTLSKDGQFLCSILPEIQTAAGRGMLVWNVRLG